MSLVFHPFIDEYPPVAHANFIRKHKLRDCYPSGNASLCLPCPRDLLFGKSFYDTQESYAWISVAIVVLVMLMFCTFVFLPAKKTSRSMYTIGVGVSYMTLAIGFLVATGEKARLETTCIDTITAAHGLLVPRCMASGLFGKFPRYFRRVEN